MALIEDQAGRGIGDLFPEGKPTARGLQALYWAARHREDPTFTWAEAGQTKLKVLTDASSA